MNPKAPSSAAPAADAAVLRDAVADDIAAVDALDARITGVHKRPYWDDALQRYGSGGTDRFFIVAELPGGRLAGFLVGEVRSWEFGAPPAGWVFAINVDPDARFTGLGRRMFALACARFRAAGVTAVRTMVDRRDHAILAFFRSQGMMAGPSLQLGMEL